MIYSENSAKHWNKNDRQKKPGRSYLGDRLVTGSFQIRFASEIALSYSCSQARMSCSMHDIIDNKLDEIYWNDGLDEPTGPRQVRRKIDMGYINKPKKSINSHRTTKEIARELESKEPRKDRLSLRLRYETLVKYKSTCLLCGDSVSNGASVEVDHIKPVSKHPELINDPDNLQVLCRRCNIAKYNRTEDDFR